jgi:hypothetical protein
MEDHQTTLDDLGCDENHFKRKKKKNQPIVVCEVKLKLFTCICTQSL